MKSISVVIKGLFVSAMLTGMVFPGPMTLGAETGEAAPPLNLPLLQGDGMDSLAAHQGEIIYLDFWASWCPPCLVSMPIMNELRNRLQAEGIAFEVLAINVDSDPGDGVDFLIDKPVDFIVVSDPDGETPAQYSVRGMPTSFLVSAEGTIVLKHEGFKRSDAQMIEQEIRKLTGNKP